MLQYLQKWPAMLLILLRQVSTIITFENSSDFDFPPQISFSAYITEVGKSLHRYSLTTKVLARLLMIQRQAIHVPQVHYAFDLFLHSLQQFRLIFCFYQQSPVLTSEDFRCSNLTSMVEVLNISRSISISCADQI